jgi:hypothetical protein
MVDAEGDVTAFPRTPVFFGFKSVFDRPCLLASHLTTFRRGTYFNVAEQFSVGFFSR